MNRRDVWTALLMCGSFMLAWLAVFEAHAAGASPKPGPEPLPDTAAVQQALSAAPALDAAALGVDVARATRRQAEVGAEEWSFETRLARRTPGAGAAAGQEAELALSRPWRSGRKAERAVQLGDVRLRQSRLAVALAWREQARQLLERHVAWLQAREAARIAIEQHSLLRQLAQGVARRHELGDAAAVERWQAQAAAAQAEAQAQAAQARADSARLALQRQFPGVPASTAVVGDPPLPDEASEAIAQALWQASPERVWAEGEAEAAAAQARVDDAERQPDPTLAWHVGRGPAVGERLVGVSISWPLGGAWREAAAQAGAARQGVAAAQRDDQLRRVQTDAALRAREPLQAYQAWQAQDRAEQQLLRIAQAQARSHALGEATLAELLLARKAANDQQLATRAAAVDAWAARWRVALEAARLWGSAPN